MQKFSNLKSIPSYLSLQNIDTDMIIPKQFLKTIKRTGLGKSLFYEMRYDENGKIIKSFILNQEPYNKSKILLQIHDELIFEVPKKETVNMTKVIKEEMSSVTKSDLHSFSTPLTVDVNIGDNWGILH